MDTIILGTPVKVYRTIRCFECNKFFEFDLEQIKSATNISKLKIKCPHCNCIEERYQCDGIMAGDRVVTLNINGDVND